MIDIHIKPVNKENWEDALALVLDETQIKYVPSVLESLAYAYIKPWDEAFDPYVLLKDEQIIGFFYLSYTPNSKDNYWIGGFQIDKQHQGKGLGRLSLERIITFIREEHPRCEVISLTIESGNLKAIRLYETFGFVDQAKKNSSNEAIYRLLIKQEEA